METSIAQNVGVDICKATLDVHLHPAGTARQFTNDAKGLKALLGWLADRRIARVVFEPTGRYHHNFERRLGSAGLPLAKVNPRQARRFAEAIGCNAKTDAVDAAMLARMGALLELPSRPIVSEILDDMKELQVARLGLVKDRTAAKNREHVCRSRLLKRHAAQRLAQIDRQIAAIDAELKASLSREPDLATRFEVLVSIPGIGETTAIAMLIEMPELGTLDSKQVASLAGLAPIARDSGQHRGKRHIRGGRAQLRHALYMPALVATRFNADMKAKYKALVAAGKPPKVAITAVMRKLVILANSLLKTGRNWTPKSA
ncbi:transposase [Sphingosinicellaceae bacterium]|nr:transposase [Sphingosinicellaceae bacterium]QXQ05903.1 transposase [Sphingosinicellaceae bacterium]QXQ06230.1 transposase [Sphingosinicellaceae bacterium]QXQ07678.1 transposase [Sphingosinicellaceae bacterium]QXQ07756.1 transposase [Sphingosinicellaceae bacterium]